MALPSATASSSSPLSSSLALEAGKRTEGVRGSGRRSPRIKLRRDAAWGEGGVEAVQAALVRREGGDNAHTTINFTAEVSNLIHMLDFKLSEALNLPGCLTNSRCPRSVLLSKLSFER